MSYPLFIHMTQRCPVKAINNSYRGLSILVLVCGLLGGARRCRIPGATPPRQYRLRKQWSDVVQAELKSAIDSKATTANPESEKNLRAAWAGTMKSRHAMVAYAQSIEQIVDAGNRG